MCGKPGHACAGTASFDLSKVFDLTPKAVITGGALMPSKAVESTGKPRYPQQHVRPGRGVPGYKGDVEVYKTPVPASFQEEGGTQSLAKRESTKAKQEPESTKAKQAPDGDK